MMYTDEEISLACQLLQKLEFFQEDDISFIMTLLAKSKGWLRFSDNQYCKMIDLAENELDASVEAFKNKLKLMFITCYIQKQAQILSGDELHLYIGLADALLKNIAQDNISVVKALLKHHLGYEIADEASVKMIVDYFIRCLLEIYSQASSRDKELLAISQLVASFNKSNIEQWLAAINMAGRFEAKPIIINKKRSIYRWCFETGTGSLKNAVTTAVAVSLGFTVLVGIIPGLVPLVHMLVTIAVSAAIFVGIACIIHGTWQQFKKGRHQKQVSDVVARHISVIKQDEKNASQHQQSLACELNRFKSRYVLETLTRRTYAPNTASDMIGNMYRAATPLGLNHFRNDLVFDFMLSGVNGIAPKFLKQFFYDDMLWNQYITLLQTYPTLKTPAEQKTHLFQIETLARNMNFAFFNRLLASEKLSSQQKQLLLHSQWLLNHNRKEFVILTTKELAVSSKDLAVIKKIFACAGFKQVLDISNVKQIPLSHVRVSEHISPNNNENTQITNNTENELPSNGDNSEAIAMASGVNQLLNTSLYTMKAKANQQSNTQPESPQNISGQESNLRYSFHNGCVHLM